MDVWLGFFGVYYVWDLRFGWGVWIWYFCSEGSGYCESVVLVVWKVLKDRFWCDVRGV